MLRRHYDNQKNNNNIIINNNRGKKEKIKELKSGIRSREKVILQLLR